MDFLVKFARTGAFCIVAGLAFQVSAAAQDGAALYRQRCQSCHGAKGEGRANQKGSDLLTAEAKGRTDAEMVEVIKTGNGKASHAFGNRGINDDQINAMVKHIRTLQGKG